MLSAMGVPSVPGHRHWVATILFGCLFLAACGSSAATKRADSRPSTAATLQILDPAPNAQTARTIVVHFLLDGARLDPPAQTGGALRPDQGHIHLSVDGNLVAMPYGLSEPVPGLAPGPHTIEAEFVASDHLSFANRVVAAVTFTVK
jgi:hypothetical protein